MALLLTLDGIIEVSNNEKVGHMEELVPHLLTVDQPGNQPGKDQDQFKINLGCLHVV